MEGKPKESSHRFGFVVSERVARELYAVLRYHKNTQVKINITRVFEVIVHQAFLALPEEARQRLDEIQFN